MKRIVRLTERDLTRLVRRVIRENKDGGTHSAMAYLADELVPNGWRKTYNANTNLGPGGVFNALEKGDDQNGASIYYSTNDMFIDLVVVVGGDIKVKKTYHMTPPDYLVDHKRILRDLGQYKNFKFAKTPYMG